MPGGNGAPYPALQTDLSPPPMDSPEASKAALTARSMTHENRAEMRSVFDRALGLAEHGQLPLHVPHEAKAVQKLRGMHYHYRPEIFLQLRGDDRLPFPARGLPRVGEDECASSSNT